MHETPIGKSVYDVVPIGDLAEVFSGYAFKSGDFTDSGVPVIKIGNIQNRKVTTKDSSCIPWSLLNERHNKFRLNKGDILLAMTGQGSVGRIGRLYLANGEECYLNQRVGKFSTNPESLSREYLFYVLSSPQYEKYLFSLGSGSGQPNLSPGDLKGVKIPFPDIKTQNKIAELLGTLDQKIDANIRSNLMLEKIVKNFYKSWFINHDLVKAKINNEETKWDSNVLDLFPNSFEDSPIGPIPLGWKIGDVGNIASKISERFKKNESWADFTLIDLGRMPVDSISLFEHGKGHELTTSICKFKKYDFLFGSIRPNFKKAGVAPFDGVSNSSVYIIRSKNDFDRSFLYSHASSEEIFAKCIQYAKGTKMPIISWDDFSNFKFALPPEDLRKEYDKVVRPFFEMILINIEENLMLERIRDSLLPLLVSGEIDISTIERLINEAND